MERRQFGKTDMQTSVLGFGSSEIGHGEAAQSTVDQILNEALNNGLNVIDTAECYKEAESLVGNAVSHRRSEFYIFTKCGHRYGVETDFPDWHPDQISGSIDHSLKRLKTDCVDLMQLHTCSKDVLAQGDVVDRLIRAREQGKTRYIGYSGDGEDARYALEMGVFDALQTSVNVADQQSIDLLLPYCVENEIGVIAKRPVANAAWRYAPNAPGGYAQPYWERLEKLQYPFLSLPLQESVEVALRFTLMQPGLCTAIVGTQHPGRWQANAEGVAKGPLSEAELAEIRDIWRKVAEADWEGLG
jgi:aryl-alcohol dehydrogenase-like predicted oxidoreductase